MTKHLASETAWYRLGPLLIALTACLLGAVVILGAKYLPLTLDSKLYGYPMPYWYADSQYYISMSEGYVRYVQSPYCRRVLYPWIAGELSTVSGLRFDLAFMACNYFSFILAAYCLALTLRKLKINPWWVLAAFSTPVALESLQRAYLPDLFHIALLSLFFLLLVYERAVAALIVLMLAFLARENTGLLCLVVAAVGYYSGRKVLLAGGLTVLLAGIACEAYFVHLGLPNRHHMPELIYTALFVPCSFLGNVLGIIVWTNSSRPDGIPFWHMTLPYGLRLGSDHEIFVAYSWKRNLETLAALLTLFGCGPMMLWFFRKRWVPVKEWAIALQIAFFYGIICYFLGTSLGRTGTFRLIGYSWPLYWLALPWLLSGARLKIRVEEIVFLFASSILLAYLPNLTGFMSPDRLVTFWLLSIPLLYVLMDFCLAAIRRRSDPAQEVEAIPHSTD